MYHLSLICSLLLALCSGEALISSDRRSFRKSHPKPSTIQNGVLSSRKDEESHPSALNCTWKYVEQPLSHFARGLSDTYMERLCVYDKYWKTAADSGTNTPGPVFFYTGNESPVEEYVNNTGLIWDLAIEFNALIVFAEHRYFGESIPEINGMSNCLSYLSSQEALADYASIVNLMRRGGSTSSIKSPMKTDWVELDSMDLSQSAFITFGGSYGGMLSSWMRIVYPHQIDGGKLGIYIYAYIY